MTQLNISADTLEPLVAFLAYVDTIFTPMRQYGVSRAMLLPNPACCVVLNRRRAYLTGRLEWQFGGGDDNHRKASQTMLTAFSRAGLIRKGRSGKMATVRFTDYGDDLLRRNTAGYRLDEATDVLHRLAELGASSKAWHGFVREVDVLGEPYTTPGIGKRIADLEHTLLPAFARGLAEDAIDTQTRVWYRLTPAGHKALAAGIPTPTPLEVSDDDFNKLSDFWLESYLQQLAERVSWSTDDRSEVFIPMSAGL